MSGPARSPGDHRSGGGGREPSADPSAADPPGREEIAARLALRRRIDRGVLTLDIEDLIRILPYRPPLLLIDRVLALVPGEHAVARKHVAGDEAGLAPRRTGFVFPATLAVEALAQLAALVASGIAIPEEAEGRREPWPELAALETCEVHRELDAPAPLDLAVSALEPAPGAPPEERRFAAHATLHGDPYVTATLVLRV